MLIQKSQAESDKESRQDYMLSLLRVITRTQLQDLVEEGVVCRPCLWVWAAMVHGRSLQGESMKFSIKFGAHYLICTSRLRWTGGSWGLSPVWAIGAREFSFLPWLLNKDVLERKVLHQEVPCPQDSAPSLCRCGLGRDTC